MSIEGEIYDVKYFEMHAAGTKNFPSMSVERYTWRINNEECVYWGTKIYLHVIFRKEDRVSGNKIWYYQIRVWWSYQGAVKIVLKWIFASTIFIVQSWIWREQFIVCIG